MIVIDYLEGEDRRRAEKVVARPVAPTSRARAQ
jgi:hypothetical protein